MPGSHPSFGPCHSPAARHKGWQLLFEVHRHKELGEAFLSTQRHHLIREQPEIKPLQPAAIFIVVGDARGIDRQLPGSLTLPATQQSAPQLHCALLPGASYSGEKLPLKLALLRGSEHPSKSGVAGQRIAENRCPQENWGASHQLCTDRGWGSHPRLRTLGRGGHPTAEAKRDVKGWAQPLPPAFC